MASCGPRPPTGALVAGPALVGRKAGRPGGCRRGQDIRSERPTCVAKPGRAPHPGGTGCRVALEPPPHPRLTAAVRGALVGECRGPRASKHAGYLYELSLSLPLSPPWSLARGGGDPPGRGTWAGGRTCQDSRLFGCRIAVVQSNKERIRCGSGKRGGSRREYVPVGKGGPAKLGEPRPRYRPGTFSIRLLFRWTCRTKGSLSLLLSSACGCALASSTRLPEVHPSRRHVRHPLTALAYSPMPIIPIYIV